ncbi:MAG: glutamate racemase [Pseudomonadota bacterium]
MTLTNTHTEGARPPRILVFDSGVGGLSICESIQQQLPHCVISYASDTAAFPYGSKPEDELIHRVDLVLHKLHALCQADIIVVACNTASTVALPKIRRRFSIPIVGVVPAVKPAAALSRTKVIGLLATPGTVKRHYTRDLITQFAGNCQVIIVGSNDLVRLAEDYLRGETIAPSTVSPIVEPFKKHADLDTVVLACTHFPLVKHTLQSLLPNVDYWVDSGHAIARRVAFLLNELAIDADISTHQVNPHQEISAGEHTALFTANNDTGDHQHIASLKSALEQRGFHSINVVKC